MSNSSESKKTETLYLIDGHALLGSGWIELVAETILIPAGQESCTRRAAIGPGDVATGEANAVPGKGIDVRRRNVLAAVNAKIGEAHVVADDEENVRFARVGRRGNPSAPQNQQGSTAEIEGFHVRCAS